MLCLIQNHLKVSDKPVHVMLMCPDKVHSEDCHISCLNTLSRWTLNILNHEVQKTVTQFPIGIWRLTYNMQDADLFPKSKW